MKGPRFESERRSSLVQHVATKRVRSVGAGLYPGRVFVRNATICVPGRLADDAARREEECGMSPSDTQLIDRPRSRRGVLGLFAAGGGAALAALLGRPERALADDGDSLVLGASNTASSTTSVSANVDDGTVIEVRNGGVGFGVGIHGFSELGPGVRGSGGVGGDFESENIALLVSGAAVFSTIGFGTVPAGRNSVFVADDRVKAEQHIAVTLVSNPGSRDLRWVEPTPGSGFRVHLSSAPPAARPATAFTYFVVDHIDAYKGG
jgi:hypothetical protein